ncbi:GNAT family N-acetyltransferase [Rhodotorula paludigena]
MVCLQPSADKPDEEGETIGWLGFTTGRYGGHHHRRGDFGLIMGSEHNGKGYATEAVEWLLEMAFVSFGLHRLEGDVYEWNAPALRVYEKCGFVIEGRRRQSMWQEGRFVDEFIIGMLQEDYRKAHPDKFERMR